MFLARFPLRGKLLIIRIPLLESLLNYEPSCGLRHSLFAWAYDRPPGAHGGHGAHSGLRDGCDGCGRDL